jgi:S-adenosylmethionine hydrolase
VQAPVISIISDYGYGSSYLAALRAVLLRQFSPVWLENVAHHLSQGDVKHAAYLYNTTVGHYPENTIHLIAVDCSTVKYSYICVVRQHNQWLITYKNELLSHLHLSADALYAEWPVSKFTFHPAFSELSLFPEIIGFIQRGDSSLGPLPEITSSVMAERLMGNMLRGKVMHVDAAENIISDITLNEFTRAHEKNGLGKFIISYRRKEKITRILNHYDEVQKGDSLAFFNASGYLEIAQNMGNASSLLGLKTGDTVIIEFHDK